MSSQTLIKAGDELNFFGDNQTNSQKLTTQSNSFRYVTSETIGTSKCVATRTGILKAEPFGDKKHQKIKIDVIPLNTNRYLQP